MTANVITYRGRSAAREVGKVLSIEPTQVDELAKVMNHFEFVDPERDARRATCARSAWTARDPTIQLFGTLWQQIQDLPRHLGQHSGGMVICQGRLDEVVPLENASMPDRVVIQWDKDDCADMGIVKVDLLGLGMMAVLQDALEVVNASRVRWPRSDDREARIPDPSASVIGHRDLGHRHIALDLAHLPPNDPAVYRMLQEADTIGIFQVESRAQMATLPRLKPETFYDIVVEVAIIRPGPIVGQMVHPYLKRRQGQEPVRVSASVARADPGADARRAALPGAAAADGDGRGGLQRRRSGGAAPRVRLQALREADAADRGEAARRDGAAGDHAGRGGGDHPLDHVVRALRLSRVARGQLRAAGLRERLPEGALPGGVLHGDAQQPADGVLPSRHAGQGRAAPRRPLRADRRAGVGLAVPRASRTAASGSASCT